MKTRFRGPVWAVSGALVVCASLPWAVQAQSGTSSSAPPPSMQNQTMAPARAASAPASTPSDCPKSCPLAHKNGHHHHYASGKGPHDHGQMREQASEQVGSYQRIGHAAEPDHAWIDKLLTDAIIGGYRLNGQAPARIIVQTPVEGIDAFGNNTTPGNIGKFVTPAPGPLEYDRVADGSVQPNPDMGNQPPQDPSTSNMGAPASSGGPQGDDTSAVAPPAADATAVASGDASQPAPVSDALTGIGVAADEPSAEPAPVRSTEPVDATPPAVAVADLPAPVDGSGM